MYKKYCRISIGPSVLPNRPSNVQRTTRMAFKFRCLVLFCSIVVLVAIANINTSWPNRARKQDLYDSVDTAIGRTNDVTQTDSKSRLTESVGISDKEKKETNDMRAQFEMMRRNSLRDRRALYLSRQVQPPFDPQYKNPCWWYDDGNNNKTTTTNNNNNNNSNSLACLPYFFLAGFPKAGTTDLYLRLTHHPLVFEGKQKEPHALNKNHFRFSRPPCGWKQMNQYQPQAHTSCDILAYAKHFYRVAQAKIQAMKSDTIDWSAFRGNTKSKTLFKYPGITVDGSSSTAWYYRFSHHIVRDIPLPQTVLQSNASIIDWIVRMNPNLRMVFILREPASRAYSDYNYFGSSTTPEQFDQDIEGFLQSYPQCRKSGVSPLACAMPSERIRIGLYHIYLEEWILRLPRKQLLFLRTEDYHNNMTHSLRGVFDFLGLPQPNAKEMEKIVTTKAKNVNHRQVQPMLSTTRNKLIEFYKPFNRKLADLLRDDAYLWEDVYSKL